MSILLPDHHLRLALIRPQIPQNTGNVARTCVTSGTALHVAGPCGFALDDKRAVRSGLDYWPRLRLTRHDSEAAFWRHVAADAGRPWLFDSAGDVSLFDAPFADGDWLVFGSETRGLAAETLAAHPGRVVRIPQAPGERCLNLATSAGIALYAALARIRVRPPAAV